MQPPPPKPPSPRPEPLSDEPARTLIARTRAELQADFDFAQEMRIGIAPTAAALVQGRTDRQLQVFSFNRYDEHRAFTIRIPLDALANNPAPVLRAELTQPEWGWAAPVAGALWVLHGNGRIDLRNPAVRGMNLAVLSTSPDEAAIAAANLVVVASHLGIPLDASDIRPLCQSALADIAGLSTDIGSISATAYVTLE